MQYVQCNPYSLICMYVVDRGMGITDQDDNDDDEEKDDDFDQEDDDDDSDDDMYVSRQGLENQLERNIQSPPMNTERPTTQRNNTWITPHKITQYHTTTQYTQTTTHDTTIPEYMQNTKYRAAHHTTQQYLDKKTQDHNAAVLQAM